jgi:hypothetical protein
MCPHNFTVIYAFRSGLENREYGRRDPSRWSRGILYPQKLALTSQTSGGRSVGIVRSQTKATEFFFTATVNCALWIVRFSSPAARDLVEQTWLPLHLSLNLVTSLFLLGCCLLYFNDSLIVGFQFGARAVVVLSPAPVPATRHSRCYSSQLHHCLRLRTFLCTTCHQQPRDRYCMHAKAAHRTMKYIKLLRKLRSCDF